MLWIFILVGNYNVFTRKLRSKKEKHIASFKILQVVRAYLKICQNHLDSIVSLLCFVFFEEANFFNPCSLQGYISKPIPLIL